MIAERIEVKMYDYCFDLVGGFLMATLLGLVVLPFCQPTLAPSFRGPRYRGSRDGDAVFEVSGKAKVLLRIYCGGWVDAMTISTNGVDPTSLNSFPLRDCF